MKNMFSKKVLLGMAIAMVCGTTVRAQVSSTFAKNAAVGQQDGIYYALPQTVLRLDFTIRETQIEEGPYSDFAVRYFGDAAYADMNDTQYELLDLKLVTETTADPNATFFLSIGSGRGATSVDLDVLENGIIRSIGVGNGANDGYVAPASENKVKEVAETIVKTADYAMIPSAGKSEDQMAKEIAEKIDEIEKAKIKLSSGFYEVALDAATMRQMYENLDNLENQYKSMLLGKTTVKTYVQSVYVIPNKEVTSMSVAKFSSSEGLTLGVNGSGNTINVQTLPLNTVANINAPSQSAVESMNYEGKVFYRVPEMANVKVTCAGKVLLEERHNVNQLGVLLMAPVNNTRLTFNTETGQVNGLKMQ